VSDANQSAWDVLARAAARRAAEHQEVLLEFLAFRLDGDPYAIPVERVREIVRLRPVTTVPRVPPEVRGVISLRGEIVQVLHGAGSEVSGILVDAVTDVLRVPDDAVQPAPSGESEFVSALCECAGSFVSVMNLERVLDLGRN
jgi:purine-binding chemotaxis protein CheW